MPIDIELTGVDDLLDWLNQAGKNVAKAENEALKAAAVPVLEDAKKNLQTPTLHHIGSKYYMTDSIRTKKLFDSLKISSVKSGKYGGKYIRVYSDDPVAHLTELGHSGDYAPAHPYLQPALEKNKAKCQEIIRNTLVEALQK